MDEELIGQVELGGRVLGHDEKAAGVLVDAVHQHAHALVLGIGLLLQAQMESQGVDQRAVVIAVTGMHHHAGGLVHHQHVFVFIDDIQGDVFRKDLQAAPLVGHDKFDHVAGPDDVIGLHRSVVHQHVTQFDGVLDAAPGGVFLMLGDEAVHPHRRLAFVGHQAEVLKHFVRAGLVLVYGMEQILRHGCLGNLSGSRVRYRSTRLPRVREVPATSDCLYTRALTESA